MIAGTPPLGRDAARARERLGSRPVTEVSAEPTAPTPCSACRGSGVVTSNLGGEPHQLPCPWCDGGGVTLREHDAQAHWRAGADADAQ
jgi:DnaJ-class molecular chaperone